MALRYPWSLLDIAPTTDEAAIRKAYAVKLRATRPDENPKGFQALREARDAALAQCRFVDQGQLEVEGKAQEPDHFSSVSVQARIFPNDDVEPVAHQETPLAGEVGTVLLADPHEIDVVTEDDDRPDVASLLGNVGKPHPWRDLKTQWGDVFDAMEADTLANHGYNMWVVLPRLLGDVRQAAGQIPDVSEWAFDPRGSATRLLGTYAPILQDFERRFGILQQDTVLLEYIGDEDARDFINALTIAVGREATPQPGTRPVINVEVIDERHVLAVWANDSKMLAYYRKARDKDQFPWSFNLLALLFPLPVALYYRLNGAAALSAILTAANAGFAVMRQRGMDAPFAPLASTVYLVVAVAIAFNWRRMRVAALSVQVRRLTDARLTTVEFGKRLIAWSKPNITGMLSGVAILIIAVVAKILARS